MSTQTKYRYANSFFITTVLYLIASFFLFYVFADTLVIEEKKQEIKTISLQHVALVEEQKIMQPEPTPTEPEIKPEPILEPVVEKPVKKKIEKPKEHVKKEHKKPIEKIVEKQVESIPTPIQNTPIEKIETVSNMTKTVLNENEKENIEAEYLSKIRHKIEKNKNYPKIAKRLNYTGKVHVTFTINKDGKIKNCKLHKSTEFESLNQAALEIFETIISFEPIPEKLNKENWEITIPIVYQLERA